MTRKKKTRSLKRIHSVKTGNISKLKRAGTVDRQSSNLKSKAKPKSVYQKFLEENPEAAEKQTQAPIANNSADKNATAKDASKTNASNTDGAKKNVKSDKPVKGNDKANKDDIRKERSDHEKEPDLLSQLDNKNFNDFY